MNLNFFVKDQSGFSRFINELINPLVKKYPFSNPNFFELRKGPNNPCPDFLLIGNDTSLHDAIEYFHFMLSDLLGEYSHIVCTGRDLTSVRSQINEKTNVLILSDVHPLINPVIKEYLDSKIIIATVKSDDDITWLYEPFLKKSVIFDLYKNRQVSFADLLVDNSKELEPEAEKVKFDKMLRKAQTIDYSLWDLRDEFTVLEASYLWFNVDPNSKYAEEIPSEIISKVIKLRDVILEKYSQIIGESTKYALDECSEINRRDLKRYAQQINQKPPFLFPEERKQDQSNSDKLPGLKRQPPESQNLNTDGMSTLFLCRNKNFLYFDEKRKVRLQPKWIGLIKYMNRHKKYSLYEILAGFYEMD